MFLGEGVTNGISWLPIRKDLGDFTRITIAFFLAWVYGHKFINLIFLRRLLEKQ
jgi:hypothetical protein